MAGRSEESSSDELCERFRGKIEPPVEKGVLKIERYAQRLTQGYSEYGGSYLWAPGYGPLFFHFNLWPECEARGP